MLRNRKHPLVESFAQTNMNVSDYLSWERQQSNKHDFFGGEVFATTGGTLRHNRATLRTIMAFENHLAGFALQSVLRRCEGGRGRHSALVLP